MPRLLIFLLFSLLLTDASSQRNHAVELSLLTRYDRHASHVTNFGRAQNDTMRLYGISYGVGLQFKQKVVKDLYLYAGVGYYRLGVDKINATQRPFSGISHYRTTSYYDGVSRFLYGTNKYQYHNISYTVGVEKAFEVKNSRTYVVSLDFTEYSTFSQQYKIGARGLTYTTSRKGQLGWGLNTSVGFKHQLGSLYLQPSIMIPIYQRLRGDEVFNEKPDMRMSKWFRGVGLSVRIGKYL